MIDINESYLFKLLQFYRRLYNCFSNVNEIFFVLDGYYNALINYKKLKDSEDAWLHHFFSFINERLRDMFYPEECVSAMHFGYVINEHVKNDEEGIKLFYTILDEFVVLQKKGCT